MAAADDDDATLVENPSALVFGIMGSGVFAIIFMVFLTFVVCVLSVPCRAIEKTVARVVIIVLTAIVVLILIFADKESKFSSTSLSDKVYDDSYIGKIAISLVMIIFSFVALAGYIQVLLTKKTLSNIENDYAALWQH